MKVPFFALRLLAAEQLEGSLLRLVARLYQILQRLLTEGVLLSGNNTPLVSHEVFLCKSS